MTSAKHRRPTESNILGRLRLVRLLSAVLVIAAAVTGILLRPPASTRNTAVLDATIADTRQRSSEATSPASPAQPSPAASTVAPAVATPAVKPPPDKELAFDFQYQPNNFFCAPAATNMALSAHGKERTQDDLANLLRTTVNGTDSAEETTRALNEVLGTSTYRTTAIPGPAATPAEMDQLQADVARTVSNGYAVVANIIGQATDTGGTLHDFPGGHYITIVGYSDDGRSVHIADSSGLFGPGTYWMSTINLANWIATRGYSA